MPVQSALPVRPTKRKTDLQNIKRKLVKNHQKKKNQIINKNTPVQSALPIRPTKSKTDLQKTKPTYKISDTS